MGGRRKRKPWDKLGDETSKAYQAFTAYISLTPSDRSIAAAARDAGTHDTWTRRWSSKHDWVKRAEAYDEHVFSSQLEEHRRNAERLVAKSWEARLSVMDEAIAALPDVVAARLEIALDDGAHPNARLAAIKDIISEALGATDEHVRALLERHRASEDVEIDRLERIISRLRPEVAAEVLAAIRAEGADDE